MKLLHPYQLLFMVAMLCCGCYKLEWVTIEEKGKITGSNTASMLAPGVCNYMLDESTLTNAGWIKVFEDDFSSGLSKWNIWKGGAYNNELQYYQEPNLQVSNSILSIVARKETVTGSTLPSDPTPKTFDFTSGRIESKAHFSATHTTPKVRMMARIRLPKGYGMWPAFWSYGDPWPTQGEIDIMEARGHEDFKYQTAYWYGRRSGINQTSGTEGYITTTNSLMDCWHIYEVIWEKNALTYYLDGQIVDIKTGGNIPNFFRKSERIILNLAVGGSFFGDPDASAIQTGTMEVDWVKVFTSK